MSKINALCVYCGSNPGTDAAFVKAAHDFGKILGENGLRLIYGGGSIGLMGALAASVIEHGGEVTGIIPVRIKVVTKLLQSLLSCPVRVSLYIVELRQQTLACLPNVEQMSID